MADSKPNQFALPRGPLGSVAGWLMRIGADPAQAEVADLVTPLRADQRVLEIGYGPGRLVRILAERAPHARIAGVDPSAAMLRQARRANREAISQGRVDLRSGEASALPYDDGTFDVVVAVNSAPAWPDLPAGLRQARRVLAGAGRLVVTWHNPQSPRAIQRRLALDPRHLGTLEKALRAEFARVDQRQLTYSVAFVAFR